MYQIAKLTFRASVDDREEQIERIGTLMSMLRSNGQILPEWIVEDHGAEIVVTTVTTDSDSLDEKYRNDRIRAAFAELDPRVETVGDDPEAEAHCTCDPHSFAVLLADMDDDTSPVICGDCGREIPLVRVPHIFEEEDHFSILSWQQTCQSMEVLWRSSLVDRFTKWQITHPDSSLNVHGKKIRKALEENMKIPVYLFLRNPIGGWYQPARNRKNLTACPSCGEALRDLEDRAVDRVCDTCRFAFFTYEF